MNLYKNLHILFILSFASLLLYRISIADEGQTGPINISQETQACIACHSVYTPGIVQDWLTSRHAKTTPEEALKLPVPQRRISTENISDNLKRGAIGCYECHGLNPQVHRDNFNHFGFRINVVVSPNDCKTCHPVEVSQFSGSKKAYAIKDLMENPVYHMLVDSIDGIMRVEKGKLIQDKPSDKTLHETCLGCHGTKIEVKGMKRVLTKLGEIEVPSLTNWPNQGVGRENPDGTLGACTACHPRHSFSIEIARKPYTCGQCHLEPDVPGYNVYKESKHGNIYESKHREWNFGNVPWVVGKDFKSPTCAACHNSLLVSPDGNIIAERSHDFGSRLWVRLFGLIYAHAQPKSGDTTIIKNADGLPLPTTFLAEPALEYLIDKDEQEKRFSRMKAICNSCHSTDWVDGHFEKLNSTIRETNAMTLAATKLVIEAWDKGIADRTNPFDEAIEKLWIKQWLFYSNSIRYASAMTGAPDYTAFKLGWWELSDNLQRMREMIDIKYDLLMYKLGGRERLK
ncbi:MAG: multiheme c-type cytochrome [Thermodesulfovibrionales bacterium]